MSLGLKQLHSFILGVSLVSACLVVVSTGRAAGAETEPQVTARDENFSLYDRISKGAVLSYFGLYKGSPLSDFTSSQQPTAAGALDSSSPLSVESLMTVGYKVKPDLIVGVVGHFLYFPVGNPVGSGQNIQMLDPMLLIQKNNLVNSGGFRLHGKVVVYLPLTSMDALQKNKLATAISPTLTASYDVPNTKLTLAAYGYLRGYVAKSDTPDNALIYRLYFAPNLSYQMTQTVAATLWVDLLSASRYRGTAFFSGMQTDTVDVQPGVSWDITRLININPVLNIYPSNPTLASTSVQIYASAKAF